MHDVSLRGTTERLRNRFRVLLSLSAAGLFLAACGGGNNESSTSDRQSFAVTVSGVDGASVSINPLRRHEAQRATVRVARDGSGAPQLSAGYQAMGPVYQYTPLGWIEDTIEIRVPFSAEAGDARLLISQPGGKWVEVPNARREGQFMVASVLRLGFATVARPVSEGINGRIRALGSTVRALTGTEEPSPFTLAIGAGTVPPLPAAEAGAWPRVTVPTSVAIDGVRNVPACNGSLVMEVIGMTWQGNLENIRYVNLGLRTLSTKSGTEVYTMPLTASDNGNWVFEAELRCKENQEYKFAYFAQTSKFTVAIDSGPAAPVITAAPQNIGVVAGAPVTFSVSSQGQGLAYEWQRSNDGGTTYGAILGASLPSFTLPYTTLDDNGSLFRVRVTNEAGFAVSSPAQLTVTPVIVPPSVTSDPSDQSVLEGESASFAVAGSGQPAPTIQWQQRPAGQAGPEAGWTDISGATSNSYTTGPLTIAHSGSQYRAVLRNSAGSSTSTTATVSVTAAQVAPTIATAPVAVDVVAGQLGLFRVVASGTSPLSYQWYRNGEAIVGANSSEVLVLAQPSDVGTSYQIFVRVSNSLGTVSSDPVAMRVTVSSTLIPADQGGTINGPAGSSLVIPPGALGSDAIISVTPLAVAASDIPGEMAVAGDAVRIGPAGLSLLQPALLQLPAPGDLPAGMTFAVLRLESLEDDGTGNSVLPSAQTNARRAAIQGATSLPPRIRPMRFRTPASLPCENPLNIDSNGMFGKMVSETGSYLTVMTPVTTCTSVQAMAATPDVPSTSEQKCVNDADFWPMTGDTYDELLSLVSRHVDCRVGTTSTEVLYTELVQANGSYRFPNQGDPVSSIGGYNVGQVRFRVKMTTFGPYNRLSKRISVTIEAIGFAPDPSYPGPNRTPQIMVRPQFQCGSSQEDNSVTPSCVVSGQPIAVQLSGGASTGEYTVSFDWPQRPAPEKDVLTFQLFAGRFEYALQGAPFIQARGEARYISPPTGSSILVRCDKLVARSDSSGCVFPDAAAVFVQRLTGGRVDENSAHIAEAQSRGAPGAFLMRPGFRAVADDSVRGNNALHRTQVDALVDANRSASCNRQYSMINLVPRASASCPNGSSGGACQCDEYPFASTFEGGFSVVPNFPGTEVSPLVSAKYIRGDHNGRAGSQLGTFYLKQRVIDRSTLTGQPGTPSDPGPAYNRNDGDSFWVKITP